MVEGHSSITSLTFLVLQATLIFGGVVSGLGLVGTKKLWENYNIIQMGAQHRPLPIKYAFEFVTLV